MRSSWFMLAACAIACAAGCTIAGGPNKDGAGSGSGSGGGGIAPECSVDADCVGAGAKCCDCPSFAVSTSDPLVRTCDSVMCPTMDCPAEVRAACSGGTCVLACAATACTTSCSDGYALDAAGCLTCTCAQVTTRACIADTDCVETRADCCGCQNGGQDTAVAASAQSTFDRGLSCPASPACPGVNACNAALHPSCVEGGCALVEALPANACGRADLPVCPTGQACTVNASDPATLHGVGVCL